jgi:hypothetical protein
MNKSRFTRTLLGFVIGVIPALIIVPVHEIAYYSFWSGITHWSYGNYMMFFAAASYKLNVAQLILNAVLLGIVGALCANMSRRLVRVSFWVGGLLTIIVGLSIIWSAYQASIERERVQKIAAHRLEMEQAAWKKEAAEREKLAAAAIKRAEPAKKLTWDDIAEPVEVRRAKKADIFDEIAEEKSKEKALKEKADPRNAPDLSK